MRRRKIKEREWRQKETIEKKGRFAAQRLATVLFLRTRTYREGLWAKLKGEQRVLLFFSMLFFTLYSLTVGENKCKIQEGGIFAAVLPGF